MFNCCFPFVLVRYVGWQSRTNGAQHRICELSENEKQIDLVRIGRAPPDPSGCSFFSYGQLATLRRKHTARFCLQEVTVTVIERSKKIDPSEEQNKLAKLNELKRIILAHFKKIKKSYSFGSLFFVKKKTQLRPLNFRFENFLLLFLLRGRAQNGSRKKAEQRAFEVKVADRG
jgi:hypothetical protein